MPLPNANHKGLISIVSFFIQQIPSATTKVSTQRPHIYNQTKRNQDTWTKKDFTSLTWSSHLSCSCSIANIALTNWTQRRELWAEKLKLILLFSLRYCVLHRCCQILILVIFAFFLWSSFNSCFVLFNSCFHFGISTELEAKFRILNCFILHVMVDIQAAIFNMCFSQVAILNLVLFLFPFCFLLGLYFGFESKFKLKSNWMNLD